MATIASASSGEIDCDNDRVKLAGPKLSSIPHSQSCWTSGTAHRREEPWTDFTHRTRIVGRPGWTAQSLWQSEMQEHEFLPDVCEKPEGRPTP
jgi:hypothetical protein